MKLFKRTIRVVIGQNDDNALSIDGLYIQIEIKKMISGKPSEGLVKIYNLSEGTESKIIDRGERIRVFAGHDNKPILIYDGDIRRVDRENQQPNRITTITLGGNLLKLSQATFNKSYSGQISVKQIVMDAIPSFNIDATDLDQIPDDSFLYDFSFTGKTSVLFDKILNPINVQWFENDGFIKFSLKEQALENVISINSGSGLIGSPAKTDTGISFRSVLNGRILLNERVKIGSRLVNGVYKMIQILHKGDNREGEFVTEAIGVNIE